MNQTVPAVSEEAFPSEQRQKWAEQIRSGFGWLYFIATMSAVSSVISLFGSNVSFGLGLGGTQLIDEIGIYVAEGMPEVGLTVRFFALVGSLGAVAILLVFGFFARRGSTWAIAVILVAYALDMLLVLFLRDYLGVLIHALSLFYIGRGALAAKRFYYPVKKP